MRRRSKSNPEYAEARNNLGCCCLRPNRLGDAREQFAQAVQAQPGFSGAAYNLARVQARLGDAAGAVTTLRRLIAQRPDWAEAHAALGEAEAARGDFAAALAEYESALRLRPDYAEAQYNAGLLLARAGRLDEAVRAIAKRSGCAPATRKRTTTWGRRSPVAASTRRLRASSELPSNCSLTIQRHGGISNLHCGRG